MPAISKHEELKAAIAGLEAQRTALGDSVVEPALAALRAQLAALDDVAGEPAPEERKIVTIVFADIAGFTALSETMDAEDVRALMNGCFDQLVPVVRRYDGTIDKFIGDQIMALFGAPVAHEDDAERALRAALEMREALNTFNQSRETSLALHIGINTGPVVAGHVGTKERQDYSVMGDAVNLAARLEDASEIDEILVGPATYRQTSTLFDFSKLPALKLKGKSEPVVIYKLLGAKASPRRVRGIQGLRASLTGRSGEFKTLRSALDALSNKKGGILALVGHAGLGKSRLLAEARKVASANAQWAEGSALPFTTGTGYWMARQLLLSLLAVDPNPSPAELAAALAKCCSVARTNEIEHYLARLLDLPLSREFADRLRFVSPENLHARMIEALAGLVSNCAARDPLVLVWEDLHWSDPSSLEVLQGLFPLTEEHAVLILITSRPDEGRALDKIALAHRAHSSVFQRLDLEPLNRQESTSLVHELLKIENVPPTVGDEILNRAEGNPFFLEELIRSFIDRGLITIEDGRATAIEEIQSIEIPETIQAVLSARIDRLMPAHKKALQNASVIGRNFSRALLSELTDADRPDSDDLDEALHSLLDREFIRRNETTRGAEEIDYTFNHAITHSVAYNSLLLARRALLHRTLAEAMERIFPERLHEMAGTLGLHYDRGKANDKALHYYVLAAEQAETTFANAEAAAFYRSALEQINPSAPDQTDLVSRLNEHLGEVLELQGFHEDARAAFAHAIEATASLEVLKRARLLRKTGGSYTGERRFDEMARHYDAAEAELGPRPIPPEDLWWTERLQSQLDQMFLLYWHGEAAKMQELAARYREEFEQYATATQHGKFFQLLALALLTGSHYQPSEECLQLAKKAVAQARGEADFPDQTHFRFVVGLVNFCARNYPEAIEHCSTALEMAERCGDVVLQTRSCTYLAAAHRSAGHVSKTTLRAKQARTLAAKLKMPEYIAMAEASLSWASWAEDDENEARRLAKSALELWHGMEDPYGFDWMALWPLIAISTTAGDWQEAVGHVRALFGPNQHPLPAVLATAAKAVLGTGDSEELLQNRLTNALSVAGEFGQLTRPAG